MATDRKPDTESPDTLANSKRTAGQDTTPE